MNIVAAIIGAIIIYFVIEKLYMSYWDHNLEISMDFSKHEAFVGEKLKLRQTIINRKALPLPLLMLKFTTSKYLKFLDNGDEQGSIVTDNYYRSELMSVLMFQKLTRELEFECTHRGDYSIDKVDLITFNIFLANKSVIQIRTDISIIVFPKIINTDQFDITFKNLLGDVITKRQLIDDPFDFRGIRDYQTNDSMKTINWKASARSIGLKVNINNYTASQKIKVLVNLENDLIIKHDNLEEVSISLAASFVNAFIGQGIQTSCYCNAYDKVTKKLLAIPSGSGDQHLKLILFSLARLDLKQELANFNEMATGLIKEAAENEWLILISASKNKDLQLIVFNNITDMDSFTWISPSYSDTVEDRSHDIVPNIKTWDVED